MPDAWLTCRRDVRGDFGPLTINAVSLTLPDGGIPTVFVDVRSGDDVLASFFVGQAPELPETVRVDFTFVEDSVEQLQQVQLVLKDASDAQGRALFEQLQEIDLPLLRLGEWSVLLRQVGDWAVADWPIEASATRASVEIARKPGTGGHPALDVDLKLSKRKKNDKLKHWGRARYTVNWPLGLDSLPLPFIVRVSRRFPKVAAKKQELEQNLWDSARNLLRLGVDDQTQAVAAAIEVFATESATRREALRFGDASDTRSLVDGGTDTVTSRITLYPPGVVSVADLPWRSVPAFRPRLLTSWVRRRA